MTKRIHICLLTSGRFELAYGGETRYTLLLGNWLVRRDYDVTLMGSGFASVTAKRLSKFDVEEEENKKSKKIRVLYPPMSMYLLSRLVLSLLWICKILLINKKTPITLIHAQDTGYSGLSAIVSGKILRIPVIISSHGIRHKTQESVIHSRLRNILLKIEYSLDIFTTKNANSVIAVNSSIKNYYEQKISKKIDFIPNPIKLKNFEFSEVNRDLIRNELGIQDNKTKVIGYVGRFSPEKNLFTLLTSFADVVQDDPSVKLVLVGTGPLEPQLREYINKRSIEDKVIFCGVRYDIDKVLACFDIFVLPSYIEGLSNALLEAMASGRGIICSDIPANYELVAHNKEALLVNPYNSQELKQAIQLLSSNDSLRLKLGCNAKMKASQYDEDIVFPKILEYYETLLYRKKN